LKLKFGGETTGSHTLTITPSVFSKPLEPIIREKKEKKEKKSKSRKKVIPIEEPNEEKNNIDIITTDINTLSNNTSINTLSNNTSINTISNNTSVNTTSNNTSVNTDQEKESPNSSLSELVEVEPIEEETGSLISEDVSNASDDNSELEFLSKKLTSRQKAILNQTNNNEELLSLPMERKRKELTEEDLIKKYERAKKRRHAEVTKTEKEKASTVERLLSRGQSRKKR